MQNLSDESVKKEAIWRKRRIQIEEYSRKMGVIVKEHQIQKLIHQIPYNDSESFIDLLTSEIQTWKAEQSKIIKDLQDAGFKEVVIPDLNGDLQKKIFKVTAVFEVEYFKDKEQELIKILKKRLQEAHFKTMPEIKVEPISEVKQLIMALE